MAAIWVLLHSFSLQILLGKNIFRILRRHLAWMKMSIFEVMVFVTLQDSEPYRRTPCLCLFWISWIWVGSGYLMTFRCFVDLQTLVILYWTSIEEHPSAVSYCWESRNTKSLSFSIMLLLTVTLLSSCHQIYLQCFCFVNIHIKSNMSAIFDLFISFILISLCL